MENDRDITFYEFCYVVDDITNILDDVRGVDELMIVEVIYVLIKGI